NDSGDAIHIQPHNDVPHDMVIFSNTVLASGTGIQVRRAEGTAYRQRVIANVVAAGTPLQGGEAANNVTLDYRPDLLDIAVPELTARLLVRSQPPRRLPDVLVRELAAYPDWQGALHPEGHKRPGASVAPAFLRTLDAIQP
ncbi:MAG: hypothetical protein Q8K35_09170, partial [Thiobacillus sp.]|nr:hypothetical protein [Thiobacillus sp.]